MDVICFDIQLSTDAELTQWCIDFIIPDLAYIHGNFNSREWLRRIDKLFHIDTKFKTQ